MELFHKIDDACVITLARGVYHQRPLFRRGDALYAGCGGANPACQRRGHAHERRRGRLDCAAQAGAPP